jgi:hypothetical protein
MTDRYEHIAQCLNRNHEYLLWRKETVKNRLGFTTWF